MHGRCVKRIRTGAVVIGQEGTRQRNGNKSYCDALRLLCTAFTPGGKRTRRNRIVQKHRARGAVAVLRRGTAFSRINPCSCLVKMKMELSLCLSSSSCELSSFSFYNWQLLKKENWNRGSQSWRGGVVYSIVHSVSVLSVLHYREKDP